MTGWTAKTVAATLDTGMGGATSFSDISTDTRMLPPGALFVALTGDRFDGHDFLEAARAAGAAAAIVRRGTRSVEGLEFFEVDDPLIALGALATARRGEVVGPVVAVTGTNGKTSTKEMLAAALGTRWTVHSTPANMNNLIGVPQTILAAPDRTDALVVEAGASEPGEIARLRDIIQPTLAVVTNVSASHLQGFGSLDAVLREKVSLVRDVPVAVVGTRPPALMVAARDAGNRVVSAGLDRSADVSPEHWVVRDDGKVTLTFGGRAINLPVMGRHQGDNAMLALAVATVLELDLSGVADALAEVALPRGRCELIERGGVHILNDTYNANPESLLASLDTATKIRGERPLVVVVSSMLELGESEARLHLEAAEAIQRAQPVLVGAMGSFAPAFEALGLSRDRLIVSDDVEELGHAVRERLRGDELVLLKASRGVRLERIIPVLAGENGS